MNTYLEYFETLPLEEDTTILKNDFLQIQDFPVLLQVWAWDGLTACSAVIPNQFSDQMADQDLVDKLRASLLIGNDYTIGKCESHTFVNFGFNT